VPLTLVATAGASNANSYITLADAETYFLARPFASTWNAATSTNALKEQALVFATKLLDREKWHGTKGITTAGASTQALAWPRQWAPTLEADAVPQPIAEYFIDTTIGYYSSLTVPTPIKDATCELALEILRAGTTDPFTKDGTRNIAAKGLGGGAIDTEYVAVAERVRGLALFPSVLALIAPLLRTSASNEVERV
jgi:hypothetical protein